MKRKKTLLWCLILVMLASILPMQAIAVEPRASLTVDFPYMGAQFALYYIGSFSPQGDFEPVEALADCPVDLNDAASNPGFAQARTLEAYVHLLGVSPCASASVGSSGKINFLDLSSGLYLLLAQPIKSGASTYHVQPLLLRLPMTDPQSGSLSYSVTLTPKYSAESEPLIPSLSLKVLKIWDDEGAREYRPSSITVYLLCDGQIYDTVILTAADNWRYRWDALPANHSWTVAEQPIEGYTLTLEQSGITFTLTNTYQEESVPVFSPQPDEPAPTAPPPERPSGPTLPQTGSLWWPVPLLALAGMILLALGRLIRRRKDDER